MSDQAIIADILARLRKVADFVEDESNAREEAGSHMSDYQNEATTALEELDLAIGQLRGLRDAVATPTVEAESRDAWAMVPREPTREMKFSGFKAAVNHNDFFGVRFSAATTAPVDIFRAMIAAAPPPPASIAPAPGQAAGGLLDKIRTILAGIDRDEIGTPDGWWETSAGVAWGKAKLEAIEALFPDDARSAQDGMDRFKAHQHGLRARDAEADLSAARLRNKALEAQLARVQPLLSDEDRMHPVGCSTWQSDAFVIGEEITALLSSAQGETKPTDHSKTGDQ